MILKDATTMVDSHFHNTKKYEVYSNVENFLLFRHPLRECALLLHWTKLSTPAPFCVVNYKPVKLTPFYSMKVEVNSDFHT